MTNSQIQAIKDAQTLVNQSKMACSFTAQKKPTKRMKVMMELLNFIKSEHLAFDGPCEIEEDKHGKRECVICSIKVCVK